MEPNISKIYASHSDDHFIFVEGIEPVNPGFDAVLPDNLPYSPLSSLTQSPTSSIYSSRRSSMQVDSASDSEQPLGVLHHHHIQSHNFPLPPAHSPLTNRSLSKRENRAIAERKACGIADDVDQGSYGDEEDNVFDSAKTYSSFRFPPHFLPAEKSQHVPSYLQLDTGLVRDQKIDAEEEDIYMARGDENTPLLQTKKKESTGGHQSEHLAGELLPSSKIKQKNEPNQTWWGLIQEAWSWNTINQSLFQRKRSKDLYPLDAVRAMAYLWVCAFHIYSALSNYYLNVDLTNAFGSFQNLLVKSGEDGAIVFFVLSGFVIPYSLMSISQRNKDHERGHTLSWRTIVQFLIRRYLRIAPSLIIVMCVVLIYSCNNPNGEHSQSMKFCHGCQHSWYDNILFIGNFGGDSHVGMCWDTTWTISSEMQFYLLSIPIMFGYFYNKWCGMSIVIGLGMFSWYYRQIIESNSEKRLYPLIYERMDQYGTGIMLFFLWEEFSRFKSLTVQQIKSTNACLARQSMSQSTSTTSINRSYDVEADTHDDTVSDSGSAGNLLSSTSSFYDWETLRDDVLTNSVHYTIRYLTLTISIAMLVIAIILLYNNNLNHYFTIALGISGLLYLLLEKTILPLNWLCSSYFWYPLSSLSYTGYLLSMITAYMYTDMLIDVNGDTSHTTIWSGNLWDWFVIYVICLSGNVLCALCVSAFIEKPLIHIAKNIDMTGIRS